MTASFQKKFLLFPLLFLGVAPLDAGDFYANKNNVALDGYDVVSYFSTNSAVKGHPSHSIQHQGVVWHFSSTENKNKFSNSPEKFLPRYGGWCAYAMGAKNTKFSPDPKTFKLYNGELLLFYNAEHGNTSIPWNMEEKKLKKQADRNWKKMAHR